jgi:hypothetical protein
MAIICGLAKSALRKILWVHVDNAFEPVPNHRERAPTGNKLRPSSGVWSGRKTFAHFSKGSSSRAEIASERENRGFEFHQQSVAAPLFVALLLSCTTCSRYCWCSFDSRRVSGFVTQHSPCGLLAVGNYVETTGSAKQEFTYQIIIFPLGCI